MRTWHKSLILVLSILTLIGGAWLLAPTAVSAQSETPAEPGGLPAARLANLFQRLQLAHQSLALRLELSDEVVASMEEWIAALQAEGKD
ncbi:MAG: hypothetical protein KC425_16240, partial [Anaerolineales bacterium]|nr:hypothetical protein [Anaerolineales bacterium]